MNAPRFFYLPTTSLCRLQLLTGGREDFSAGQLVAAGQMEQGTAFVFFPDGNLRLGSRYASLDFVLFLTTCLPFPMLFSGRACLPNGSTPSRRSGTLTRGEHPDVVTHGILTGSGATATRGARLYK